MKVENTQWQEHLTEIDKYMCVGGAKIYYLETYV